MITFVLGDFAIARICKNVYRKVRIVKNEDGIFFDNKLLGLSEHEDGTVKTEESICYYVEICISRNRIWVPWKYLSLAERSRPFYGPTTNRVSLPKTVNTRKRKIHPDHTLPMNVKKHCLVNPDLNTTYDHRHAPKLQDLYENAFKDFVRRGKEMIFDELLEQFPSTHNYEKYSRFVNFDVPTEDKICMIIEDILTEKEIEKHLYQCWRFNIVYREEKNESVEMVEDERIMNTSIETVKPPVVHITWCLVCGKRDKLVQCMQCPSSFHANCKDDWLVTIIHRKNPPKTIQDRILVREKKLSSTRTVRAYEKNANRNLCPSCTWGPTVGYGDIVWQKLGHLSWWPAKVLTPGMLPSCLITRKHTVQQWPVRYYGTLNYSWSDTSRMCLFMPSHNLVLEEDRPEDLQEAVMDACDDYIAVYLT